MPHNNHALAADRDRPATPILQHRMEPCPTCGHQRRQINGRWLRKKREAAGLGLREMARLIPCSAPYLSDIERNKRTATEKIVKAYAAL